MGAATAVWPCIRPLSASRVGMSYVVKRLVAGQSKMAHTPPNPRYLAPSNRNVN